MAQSFAAAISLSAGEATSGMFAVCGAGSKKKCKYDEYAQTNKNYVMNAEVFIKYQLSVYTNDVLTTNLNKRMGA
jgi:hypothetical protein